MSELPSVSTTPFFIAVEPIGTITGSPFNSLREALETARALHRSGHIIRSISNGQRILEGVELLKALGPVPPRPSLFGVSSDYDVFNWHLYQRSNSQKSLDNTLAPTAEDARIQMGLSHLRVCEDEDDPTGLAATHYLARGNQRCPDQIVWLCPA